jgi:hypothetical protein
MRIEPTKAAVPNGSPVDRLLKEKGRATCMDLRRSGRKGDGLHN